jgi:hypothetical protein
MVECDGVVISACGSELKICLAFDNRKIKILDRITFEIEETVTVRSLCYTVCYEPADSDFIASGAGYSYYIRCAQDMEIQTMEIQTNSLCVYSKIASHQNSPSSTVLAGG